MELQKIYSILVFLYVLAGFAGLLGCVPMLFHVAPFSKCILFATREGEVLHNGHYTICSTIGYGHLLISFGAFVLGGLSLKNNLELKKHATVANAAEKFNRKLFTAHITFFILSLFLSVMSTTGYSVSCNNIEGGIQSHLRNQMSTDPYDTRGEEIKTRLESDYTFHRYTILFGNAYGAEHINIQITCRAIFTDPMIHKKLHDSHVRKYSSYYGHFHQLDLGAYWNDSYQVNTLIESSITGSWLSTIIWAIGIGLVIYQKYKMKQKLAEECEKMSLHSTMFGYNDGGSSYNGGTLSQPGTFQRGCPSRGSNYSLRSTKSVKRDIDDIALSLVVENKGSTLPRQHYIPSDGQSIITRDSRYYPHEAVDTRYRHAENVETEIF